MRKDDFGYIATAEGYMLQYKGHDIGGAGIIGKYRGSRKRAQILEYSRIAEAEINRILSGNLGRYEKPIRAIDKHTAVFNNNGV